MKIKPIKTIYDYNQAQKYLESIFHNELTEEEANDVAVLEILIENFERLIIVTEKSKQYF